MRGVVAAAAAAQGVLVIVIDDTNVYNYYGLCLLQFNFILV